MHFEPLFALAAAGLVGQAIASPHHGLRHAHQKRAYVTELVTVTDWVTVTVYEGDTKTDSHEFYTNSRKNRPQPSSESTTSSPPAPAPVVATTIVTQVTSTSAASEKNTPPVVQAAPPPSSSSSNPPEVVNAPPPPPPAPSSTAEPAPPPAPVPALAPGSTENSGNAEDSGSNNNDNGGSTGGAGGRAKRGLAYNHPDLLQRFLSTGTKVSWAYNWGQYDDSKTNLEFCPMLWGLKLDFAQTWPGNAQKAIDAGSRCLLSFNEPDLGEQANMSPQLAAEKHIELMNPFAGKALIGSPAITNSGADHQGISWMRRWLDACGGRCAVDFLNIHIYGVDTNTFLAHLRNVHDTFKKPVWITEFAFGGSEEEINSQLATVIDQIENNATYSFVERYSYFMVQDGFMVKGNSLSTYGSTFAYGA